ncbi:MAG TPA: neutral zinc metallopeptidase [Bryobacteraceae bacterium]|nr:neutral zinc metallopeptidase [Bryobacteraceae bacterium]
MEWTPGGESQDIEDRRGDSGGGGGGGGGGFSPMGFGGIHLGIGGTIVLIVLSLVFKTNLFSLFSGGGGGGAPITAPTGRSAPAVNAPGEQREVQFVSFVLDDVQHTWETLLPQQTNFRYRHAKLVLFRDSYPSACGTADEASGPFYCPGDEKVYLDLGFFNELSQRFGAPGEFAQAYVIAHELGHHVQKILGIEAQVRQAQERNRSQVNPLSVRLELQADCFAGIWAKTTEQRKIVNSSDVKAGLQAAAAVGDDRLQRMAGRQVSPETFTHGSSAQRTHWFETGMQEGTIKACNTFNSNQ